jgi:hypothetical protein
VHFSVLPQSLTQQKIAIKRVAEKLVDPASQRAATSDHATGGASQFREARSDIAVTLAAAETILDSAMILVGGFESCHEVGQFR